jgi:hypothetical protein
LQPVTGPDGQPCEVCGASLFWDPAGTLQVCANPDCAGREEPIFPPALLPREKSGDVRRVPTPDERLTAALELAGQREQLLAWIDERLATRLGAESRGHLGVFRAEIQQADNAARLTWLAGRLAALPLREQATPQAVRGEVIHDQDQTANTPGQLLALPPGKQATTREAGHLTPSLYRPCDRCRELSQRGPDGRWPAAAVQVEITGQPAQPGLCAGCLTLVRAQHPSGGVTIHERYWQVA